MGLVLLVVVGGILGWLAGIVMRENDKRGILLNVAVGIGGALVTGLVAPPLLGLNPVFSEQNNIDGLLTALGGSIAVLFALNVLRNRELR